MNFWLTNFKVYPLINLSVSFEIRGILPVLFKKVIRLISLEKNLPLDTVILRVNIISFCQSSSSTYVPMS